MSLNSLTAVQFPPFSSEPFSLPTSTPSGLWGKLLMKGWKSHFFKEGKFFGKKIELKHILSLLIKYMPVLYFRQMQINPLLLCSAQKHMRLAFVTPGLYNVVWRNQAWGTYWLISWMYFIIYKAETLEFGLFLCPLLCWEFVTGTHENCFLVQAIPTGWLLLKVACFPCSHWEHCSKIYAFWRASG